MHGLAVYVKEGLPLHGTHLQKTLQILIYVFNWLYVTQCLTSFSSINHLLLCAQFFILFHLTQMRFSPLTHLLMCFSLETSTFIMRTGLLILVELIDLVSSPIIFLSQTTLLRWLTFLLASQTMILSLTLLDLFLSSNANTFFLLSAYRMLSMNLYSVWLYVQN